MAESFFLFVEMLAAFFPCGLSKFFLSVICFLETGAGRRSPSSVSFLSIERVLRFAGAATVFAPALDFVTTGSGFDLAGDFSSFLLRFGGGFLGLGFEGRLLVAFGLTNLLSLLSSSWKTTSEKADSRRGVIGMKNGLGQGELM